MAFTSFKIAQKLISIKRKYLNDYSPVDFYYATDIESLYKNSLYNFT